MFETVCRPMIGGRTRELKHIATELVIESRHPSQRRNREAEIWIGTACLLKQNPGAIVSGSHRSDRGCAILARLTGIRKPSGDLSC